MTLSALVPSAALANASPLLFTLVVIFLAELGDKTLYTIVVLATQSHAMPVLFGGWAAFLVQGVIAVLLGSVLHLLPPKAVVWTTAIVFAVCAIWLFFKKEEDDSHASEPLHQKSQLRQFLTAFGMVFLAEFGDATQVGSAALVARFNAPVRVFIGATLGLWLGTILAVGLGKTLGSRLPTGVLRRAAAVLFLGMAIFTVWRI